MPNELYILSSAAVTPYAIVRRMTDFAVANVTTNAFETFVDASLASYVVPLDAKGGDAYAASFPTWIAGPAAYAVQFYDRAGSSPSLADVKLAERRLDWTGTRESVPPPTPVAANLRRERLETLVPPEGSIDGTNLVGLYEHLRIREYNEPSTLALYLAAATDYAETALSMYLLPRTLLATFYAGEPQILPKGPLIEIISAVGADGIAATSVDVSHAGHRPTVSTTPALQYPVSVTYRAGFDPRSRIPASIRLAIYTHVGTLYENRESVSDGARLPVPHSLEDFYRLKSRARGIA